MYLRHSEDIEDNSLFIEHLITSAERTTVFWCFLSMNIELIFYLIHNSCIILQNENNQVEVMTQTGFFGNSLYLIAI